MDELRERWNHNTHYHRVVLDAVGGRVGRALDVGCGNGLLTAELPGVADRVVGLDVDEPSVRLAREEYGRDGIEFVTGDLFTHPFDPETFDLVASVAMLHHVDAGRGLARMAELLRPGGTLAVVGLARVDRPGDALRALAGAALNRPYQLLTGRRYWQHSAPIVWPPPESYSTMRATTRRLLPGARFRTHLFWRYSITWVKPAGPTVRLR